MHVSGKIEVVYVDVIGIGSWRRRVCQGHQ